MESNEKLGVIDNNDKALELTEKGFKRVQPSNSIENRKIAASLMFFIFTIIGLICFIMAFNGGIKDGIFGFFAFICFFFATIFFRGIISETSRNKERNKPEHSKINAERRIGKKGFKHYHRGSHLSEDDPITGTDYAGSDGNIYS